MKLSDPEYDSRRFVFLAALATFHFETYGEFFFPLSGARESLEKNEVHCLGYALKIQYSLIYLKHNLIDTSLYALHDNERCLLFGLYFKDSIPLY